MPNSAKHTGESDFSVYRFMRGQPITIKKSRFEDKMGELVVSLLTHNTTQNSPITALMKEIIINSIPDETIEAISTNNERKLYVLAAHKKAVLDAVGTFDAYQKDNTPENKDQFLAALDILKMRNISPTVGTAIASKTNMLMLALSLGAMLAVAGCLIGSIFFPPLAAVCIPLAYTAIALFAGIVPIHAAIEGIIIATNKHASLGTQLASALQVASHSPLKLFDQLLLKCAGLKKHDQTDTAEANPAQPHALS